MKTLLISAFAACIIVTAPTALLAQDRDKGHGSSHGGGGGGSSQVEHRSTGGMSGGHGMGGVSGNEHRSVTTHHVSGSMSGGMSGGTTHHYRTSHYHGTTGGTTHYRGTTYSRGTSGRTTTEGRMGTRGTHANVDVSQYRKNVTATQRYHYGEYNAPSGYSYRRWSYGDRLPDIYFGQQFWITNYLNFGLFAPPDGYVWVRYGPDALLIDEDTGEIIQVEYGLFY